MRPAIACCCLLSCFLSLAAGEGAVMLQAPLSTLLPIEDPLPARLDRIEAELVVPADAPADLGVGAWLADDEGRWHQRFHPGPLGPGHHRLRFALDDHAAVHAEGHRGAWSRSQRSRIRSAGLLLFSASASRATILVTRLEAVPEADARSLATSGQLRDLRIAGARWQGGRLALASGERMQLSLRPEPFPENPCDPAQFLLSAAITDPLGEQRIYEGFYHEPQILFDRGDHEAAIAAAPAGHSLRFRPGIPGRYTIELRASWHGGEPLRWTLPPLEVSGEPWDEHVRRDPDDPRFFVTGLRAAQPRCWWPPALNARSVWDRRGAERTGSRLSPDRRWHAYAAYLERWAAAGIGAVEIWMANWNLALEWRDDWRDYPGLGRYSQVNAERLDRLLDRAYELGIRVNLVINNHGQASLKTNAEWADSPYNARIRGGGTPGPVPEARQFFTHPAALAGQERRRRYIVARWGDHPAVMGWKLWTEMNLTAGGREELRAWHIQAAERWHALDHYDHPVTSHWSGNYRTPDRAIVAQPGLDYVCIDAYHGRREDRRGTLLSELFWRGLHEPQHHLAQYAKPIVITEYGGSHLAAPPAQLLAEHQQGHWSALMAGYATGPMLWWLEWVDQGPYYDSYSAIARFVAGEDLRSRPGSDARGIALAASGGAGELWCRAWSRPGRILGYVLDADWGYDGLEAPEHPQARITIGSTITAGAMAVEWWDADRGTIVDARTIDHPGGPLELQAPPFRRHLAFKLWRIEGESEWPPTPFGIQNRNRPTTSVGNADWREEHNPIGQTAQPDLHVEMPISIAMAGLACPVEDAWG